jgi:hypothetical protein
VSGEGVAADQGGQRDQLPGIGAEKPGDGDRVEHDQRRDRVTAAHGDRDGDRDGQGDRSGVQRAGAWRRLGAKPGERGGEESHRHAGAESRLGHNR